MPEPLAIALPCWRRPDYLRQVLAALARCAGVADAVLLPAVEPGDDEVRALVEGFGACESRPTWNRERLGAGPNIAASLRAALEVADYVLLLEEDVVPAADFFGYHAWARDRYRADPAVGSVAAYHRRADPCPPAERRRVRRRVGFHTWGAGHWRDRLVPFLGRPHLDTAIDAHHRATGLVEVYPELSRVQNVGLVTTAHDPAEYPPAWFAEHHRLRHWAGSPGVVVAPGPFHEGEPPLLLDCGAGVTLGNNAACAAGGFDATIHIVRGPDDPRSCPPGRAGAGLAVTWTEGEPIGPHARRILDFARATAGSLLVHCEGGIYRSPHAALLACLGRGLDPLAVLPRLTEARWREAGHAPEWQRPYLDAILALRAEEVAAGRLVG